MQLILGLVLSVCMCTGVNSETALASLIGKTIHTDALIGAAISSFKHWGEAKSGDITIPNTKIVLHYHADKCHFVVTGKKRFLPGGTLGCDATVSENVFSHTSSECSTLTWKDPQRGALKCAMDAEIKKLKAFAG